LLLSEGPKPIDLVTARRLRQAMPTTQILFGFDRIRIQGLAPIRKTSRRDAKAQKRRQKTPVKSRYLAAYCELQILILLGAHWISLKSVV
jgi:hypothetical protein